jgi:hypothetical protein
VLVLCADLLLWCPVLQKVVELALACLHKLVAHAWLHGESTAAGTMDILSAHGSLDDDDTVANVIKMVIKCGESTNEALQLAVVRALLTFTTAGRLGYWWALRMCIFPAAAVWCGCALHDWAAVLGAGICAERG